MLEGRGEGMDSLVSGCFEAHRDGDVPQWGVMDRWHGGGCEAVTSSPGRSRFTLPALPAGSAFLR